MCPCVCPCVCVCPSVCVCEGEEGGVGGGEGRGGGGGRGGVQTTHLSGSNINAAKQLNGCSTDRHQITAGSSSACPQSKKTVLST